MNVGAADGYYAVGLALRLPEARVVAFEALQEMHAPIEAAAHTNGVQRRIALRGRCELDQLRAELTNAAPPTLIFMDIEGGEVALLDPAAAPELRQVDILVETHDMYVEGCTTELTARFRATHDIEQYTTRARTLSDFPARFIRWLTRLAPRLAVELMNERRPAPQHWLYMRVKANL